MAPGTGQLGCQSGIHLCHKMDGLVVDFLGILQTK